MSETIPVKQERGWGLTILIPLSILGSLVILATGAFALASDQGMYAEFSSGQPIVLMAQAGLNVVFLAAVWRRKRWGCFGLMAVVAVSAVLNLLAGGQPSLLVASLVSLVLYYLVYREREAYFDQS